MDQESANQKVGKTHAFLNAPILTFTMFRIPCLYRLQESKEAHEQLMAFMRSQVAERKADITSGSSSPTKGGNDIFTMLVRANEDEGKFQLNDQELIGDVFIMLIAGHGAYYY